MIKNIINKCLWVLMISLIFTACETGIDIIHESESIPVVYCLLDPDDSIHYVRVQKTFTGAENALYMAKIPDSIYYSEAIVKLESWENNYKIQTIFLKPTTEKIKDKGIFASNKHIIYKTTEKLLGKKVSLSVDLPDSRKTVYSMIDLINTPHFTRPRTLTNQIELFNFYNPFEIQFTGGGPYNELGIRVYYSEFRNNIEEKKMVEIMKTRTMNPSASGFVYYLREENFFRPLSMAIGKDTSVNYRKFKQIDIVAYSACEEFLQFQELYQTTNDLYHMPYSNIINGHGLLASRTSFIKDGFVLTRRSLDSLANGRLTSHLNFVN